MKTISLAVTAVFIMLLSCTKQHPKVSSVLIRIKNNTNKSFVNVIKNDSEFGSINVGAITTYKPFDEVIAYAGAQIVIQKDTMYAGNLYCGTPPLPYLEKGKYTLEIFEDNNSWRGYNAKYIKD
jgi:hypothetical protein